MSEHANILTPSKQPSPAAIANDVAEPALEKEQQQLLPIQCSLTVGAPDDPLEDEADAMADTVMRMPLNAPGSLQVPDAFNGIQRKCAHCEEEEETAQRKPISSSITPFIQTKSNGEGTTSAELTNSINNSRGSGTSMDDGTRSFMESRFGSDFSSVKIHTGSESVMMNRELNAKAFTVGNDIYFNEGQYNPQSAEGKHLLAHELTHTIQQEKQAQSVQRARVPNSADTNAVLPAGAPTSSRLYSEIGMARVLSRAWAALNSTQQANVRTATAGLGITWTDEESLRSALISFGPAQLASFAQAIRTEAPASTLGDPLLINTGPRTGTADATNITTLVTNANAVFAILAGTTRDSDIGAIFGTANIATAKTKYNNAKVRMDHLHTTNRIVTDRSGYNAQVGLGGLTNSNRLSVSPGTIDNPNNNESVITMIHESMHAGNSDVRDYGYIHQPSFTSLAASVKLTNAAHFEVVPRRILGAARAFTGQTFIPAGTTVGGVTAPPLTPREEAIRGASELFRQAWLIGLNLHNMFVRVYATPSEWNTLDLSTAYGGVPAGTHFSDTLPFWSNVEGMTIHDRLLGINPAGTADVRPVTIIDIALSEGLVRKLSIGMNSVPQTEAAALAFETANATAAEITAAAASVAAERDLLVRLILRVRLGRLTGTVARDERVVARMGTTTNTWADILAVRAPGSFV